MQVSGNRGDDSSAVLGGALGGTLSVVVCCALIGGFIFYRKKKKSQIDLDTELDEQQEEFAPIDDEYATGYQHIPGFFLLLLL